MSLITIFITLIVFISILLILVIMVQNPKGGGLSSAFGGGESQVIGGVKSTGNFLEKSTWTLATVLLFLILLSNTVIKNYDTPAQVPVEEEGLLNTETSEASTSKEENDENTVNIEENSSEDKDTIPK